MYTTSKFMKQLLKSNKIYNTVIKDVRKDLFELSFFDKIEIPEENLKENFKKNFFSIFMLSLIEFLKAEREDIVKYGKCLFYLRGIITCTDNIIDNESEGMRERAVYKEYPDYKFISRKIHSGIGGELLKIGILVPLYREKNDKFKDVSNILYNLGMSLQGLDDLCDMEEDFYAGKINLATSFFMNKLQVDEETAVNLDILTTPATEEYLKEIIGYSMESFRMLEGLGYPINKKLGMKLLSHLFKIRGLGDLWNIYSGEEQDEKNNFRVYAFNG